MTADRVLLWRHGRTASNADGRFQGQLDIPMDDIGHEQAARAAALLAVLLAGQPCRIVSSDLSRACATAQPLAELLGLPVIPDADLRETYAGDWEGLLRQEIEDRFPADFVAWRAGEDVPVGGGERRSESARRAEAAIRRHAASMDGGILVAVSHGAALRGGMLRLMGLDARAWSLLDGLRNAHWAELRRRGDAWLLSSYNIGPLGASAGVDG